MESLLLLVNYSSGSERSEQKVSKHQQYCNNDNRRGHELLRMTTTTALGKGTHGSGKGDMLHASMMAGGADNLPNDDVTACRGRRLSWHLRWHNFCRMAAHLVWRLLGALVVAHRANVLPCVLPPRCGVVRGRWQCNAIEDN